MLNLKKENRNQVRKGYIIGCLLVINSITSLNLTSATEFSLSEKVLWNVASASAPVPFLQRPFNEVDVGIGDAYGLADGSYGDDGLNYNSPADKGVNAFLDHDSPEGSAEPQPRNSVIAYRGRRTNASTTAGLRSYSGHRGVDFALSVGKPVLAAADGWVISINKSSPTAAPNCGVIITMDHANGYKTRYLHLGTTIPANIVVDPNKRAENWIAAGTKIGQVGSQTCFGAHLHFDVFYNNVRTDPYGFCPDTITQDPWEIRSGVKSYWLWKNIASPCQQQNVDVPNSTPKPRIAVLLDNKTLKVKEGNLDAAWVTEHLGIMDFQISEDRIAVLFNDGHLFIKEGSLDAEWVDEAQGVASFQLEADRIGILYPDGIFFVKEGDLDAGWVQQADGIVKFQLEKRRIGILYPDGIFFVKEGDLDASWVQEQQAVIDFQLEKNRIGVSLVNKAFLVKEGNLDAAWVTLSPLATRFQLDAQRVAITDAAGNLFVKEGNLDSLWYKLNEGIVAFQLNGNRVGSLFSDGKLFVKEGNLDTSWVLEAEDVVNFQLDDNRIGSLRYNGKTFVKQGDLNSNWVEEDGNTIGFQLNSTKLARHLNSVTKTFDRGNLVDSHTPNTLSYVFSNFVANKPIMFALPFGTKILVSGNLATLPTNSIIMGHNCNNPIFIEGSNSVNGLTLSGNNQLSALNIFKFTNVQIKTSGTQNRLICTTVYR